MTMTTYTIKNRKCSNASGECFEVWQDDVCFIGTFTRRFWAEAWIADMLAGIESGMPVTEAAERAERDSIWFAAFALTASGPEEIGRYTSVREAVTDMLNRWPKDTEKDVAIMGHEGTVVHLWRGLDDPAYCDVVYPDRREGYRCLHVTGEDGRVQTRVTRLE